MIDPDKASLDVDALARRLPRREPGPERSAVMRHAILDAAGPVLQSEVSRTRRGWMIGASAVAAAACAWLVLRTPEAPRPAPAPSSSIAAADTARRGTDAGSAIMRPAPSTPLPDQMRLFNTPLPDGVSRFTTSRTVQVSRGKTTITAPPGAIFEVEVRNDQIQHVAVTAGWVVLASARAAETIVVARQTWTLEMPELPPPVPGTPRDAASPAAWPPGPPPAAPPGPPPAAPPGPPPAAPPGLPPAAPPGPPPAAPPGPPPAAPPGPPPAAPPALPALDASPARPTALPPPASGLAAAESPPAPNRPPAPLPEPSRTRPAILPIPSTDCPVSPDMRSSGGTKAVSGDCDRVAGPPPPPGPPAHPTREQDFRNGLRALLAGDALEAAAPLDRACNAASNSQDDICYWAAVAHLRSGDALGARRRFDDLLTRWPVSAHAGEANIALGWLLLKLGDRTGARARFAAAANDRMPSLRADALRGLAAAQ